MKKIILILAVISIGACNSKRGPEHVSDLDKASDPAAAMAEAHKGMDMKDSPMHGNMKLDVDMIFQQQLKDLIIATTKLSSEFVTSDAEKVKAQATVAMKALNKVDRKLLTDQGNNLWMEALMVIAHKLQTIEKSDDIEVQREAFAIYSNSIFFSAKAFGIADQEVYYQYCPMAFDNKGAYWLSSTQEILNPYFGDKMLHCGTNKDGINVEIKEDVNI